ncbi:MAG: hypothetical protein NUV53_01435 [Patescibacteria group bacterium]|nr:hypothetical protein [Patescibacteria group bacterium]
MMTRLYDWIAHHRLLAVILTASFILIIGGMVWAYVALHSIAQPLIIHFTERAGITEVGSLFSIMQNSVFWLLLCMVNSVLAVVLVDRDRFLSFFVAGGMLLVSILIFIWFAVIIHVN